MSVSIDMFNNVKNSFQPSPYQQRVFDFIETGEGNAVVNAVAGSGKTTTIVEALKNISADKTSIFIAFNKSIVEELRGRVPVSTDVKTIHAIGLEAIKKHFGSTKVAKNFIDSRKYTNIAKKLQRLWNVETETAEEENKREYLKKIVRICELIRQNLYTMDTDYGLVVQTCLNNGIVAFDICVERAMVVAKQGIDDVRQIDFIDMLCYPMYYDIPLPRQYDWVFIDECQDLNIAQQHIMQKLVKPGGRWIAVGDPSQAIYGFAGADVESFNKLRNSENTQELPLSISYRCSKKVVEFAKKLVPHLESNPNAPDGEVNEKSKLEAIKEGDFVLCRNAYPLVKCAIHFLSKGRRISIIGSDIGKSLIDVIDKTSSSDVNDMLNQFTRIRNRMIQRLLSKGYDWSEAQEHETISDFDEKVSMIKAIANGFIYEKVLDVINKIEEIFGEEDKSGITFATIHKAKGLEAETVHIICHELMPSPKATKPWQQLQEQNLMYVAFTRAKHTLNFVEDFSA